jgi:hypothetical protein
VVKSKLENRRLVRSKLENRRQWRSAGWRTGGSSEEQAGEQEVVEINRLETRDSRVKNGLENRRQWRAAGQSA